jgi:Lipoprotein LpqB beta-propeller domain/Sporulation and spore germination
MSRMRVIRAGLAIALTTGVLAACAQIPDSGPTTRVGGEIGSEEDLVQFEPAGPAPGASPTETVTGFIEAMQAIPQTTEFAKEFLTKEAGVAWDPSQETVVYQRYEATPIGRAGTVSVQVQRQATLDSRGAYRAVSTSEAADVHRYRLRREAGEWRITNPRNAFYVSDYTFTSDSYQPYSLYFFAPSFEFLVPYPIYLPTGDQLATSLVQGVVLDGPPGQPGERQLLTAVPPDTTVDPSVSITAEGVAEIRLNGPLLGLDSEQRRLLSAQLVTTVSQVPGVEGVRLFGDGARLEGFGETAVQDVSGWVRYDGAQIPARSHLFALDAGRLVEVSDSVDSDAHIRVEPLTDSMWTSQAWGIRSFDVDLDLSKLLAVDGSGVTLLTGKLYNSKGPPEQLSYTGTDLSQPVATPSREWLVVDRQPGESRLLVVRSGGAVQQIGRLSRERVSSLSLSPDGTRFAAIAQRIGAGGPGAPRLVLGQIRFGEDGSSAVGVVGVHDLVTTGDVLGAVRSVTWVDGTTLGVLGSVSGVAVEPYTVRIDGSELNNDWILPTEVGVPATLVASLSEGDVYIRNAGGRLWFDNDGTWTPVGHRPLAAPTFPG